MNLGIYNIFKNTGKEPNPDQWVNTMVLCDDCTKKISHPFSIVDVTLDSFKCEGDIDALYDCGCEGENHK